MACTKSLALGRSEGSFCKHARANPSNSASCCSTYESIRFSPRKATAATTCAWERPAHGTRPVSNSHNTTPKEYTSVHVVCASWACPSIASGAWYCGVPPAAAVVTPPTVAMLETAVARLKSASLGRRLLSSRMLELLMSQCTIGGDRECRYCRPRATPSATARRHTFAGSSRLLSRRRNSPKRLPRAQNSITMSRCGCFPQKPM
mmetsp:Transcript_1129/g.3236  ORF Transcript_1129/g.3236 Transcript_1129/m.3236 type:complete len:205 (-) Transcript_1129:455-1069(-)